jgi:hypothetical protein
MGPATASRSEPEIRVTSAIGEIVAQERRL